MRLLRSLCQHFNATIFFTYLCEHGWMEKKWASTQMLWGWSSIPACYDYVLIIVLYMKDYVVLLKEINLSLHCFTGSVKLLCNTYWDHQAISIQSIQSLNNSLLWSCFDNSIVYERLFCTPGSQFKSSLLHQ